MNKILATLIVLAVSPALVAAEGTIYGEPLTGKDTTEISVLMADPGKFLGQTVRVEGTVTGVCEMRGCWMTLAWDKDRDDLRVKVDDGVIVFPVAAKGKHAVAEGEFTRIDLTLEQTVAYKKHHAEEQDEEFDPSTVTAPMTYYEIKATGAVIR